ncbi:arsenate reductase ArsC [Coraliomargarita sp. W4R53]
MKKLKVLFLCTGNSARSLFAEHILRARNSEHFEAYSAGADPKESPHPMTLRVLENFYKIDTSSARSKSWDTYKDTPFDIVITVCDKARETCPNWPSRPIVAHWSSPDPAACTGSDTDVLQCFKDVALQITRRIDIMLALPIERFEKYRIDFEKDIQAIGNQP